MLGLVSRYVYRAGETVSSHWSARSMMDPRLSNVRLAWKTMPQLEWIKFTGTKLRPQYVTKNAQISTYKLTTDILI